MKRPNRKFDPLAEAPAGERSLRAFYAPVKWILVIWLISFSVFQLFSASNSLMPRAIAPPSLPILKIMIVHLMFALTLVFIMYAPLKRLNKVRWLFYVDLLLVAASFFVTGYLLYYYEDILQRAENNTVLDLVVGTIAVVLVLEATRRCVSPVLVVVAAVFMLYALIGPRGLITGWTPLRWLPMAAQHRGLDFDSLIAAAYLTSDGVFEIPLQVSATFVFLFVLFGAALERSGGGRYLIDMAFSVMGRFRGGPAKSAVMASGLMGTMSGSSIANTVSTGSLTIPLMKKAGFRPHVAGAVEVAASTNGQLMPPVMGAAAFLIVEITGISYKQVVIAALLPALLSYLAIFTMIHLEAVKQGLRPMSKEDIKKLSGVILKGLPLNIPLIGLVCMLLVFNYTPLTSAGFAILITILVYALNAFLSPFAMYGIERVKGRGFPYRGRLFTFNMLAAFRDAAMNMAPIAVACACCGLIITVFSRIGLPPKMGTLIQLMSGGQLFLIMLLTAITCLIMGIGLPTTATYVIMATIVVPAILTLVLETQDVMATTAVILSIHLFVFYYGILADDTPPVGLCAYAASGIAGSDPIRTGFASFRFDLAAFSLPFIFFYKRDLLLVDIIWAHPINIDLFTTAGTWFHLIYEIPAAIIGILCFAAALQGHTWRPTWLIGRILLLASALSLIAPQWWTVLVALIPLALYLAWDLFIVRTKLKNPNQISSI